MPTAKWTLCMAVPMAMLTRQTQVRRLLVQRGRCSALLASHPLWSCGCCRHTTLPQIRRRRLWVQQGRLQLTRRSHRQAISGFSASVHLTLSPSLVHTHEQAASSTVMATTAVATFMVRISRRPCGRCSAAACATSQYGDSPRCALSAVMEATATTSLSGSLAGTALHATTAVHLAPALTLVLVVKRRRRRCCSCSWLMLSQSAPPAAAAAATWPPRLCPGKPRSALQQRQP